MLQGLDRLKVFHFVYSNGSVVAAASELHVSQSAVSQSIKKLEQEIGTPLFIRLHKKLIPTAAGKELSKIVCPFIGALNGYMKDLEFAKNYPAGELRIGAPPEFGKAYLPLIVAGFRDSFEQVTFKIKLGTPEKLLPMIQDGELDFGLVDMFLAKSTHIDYLDTYHFTPLVEEEVVLACSRRYYDNHLKGQQSFTSLVKLNYISYKEDLQTIRQWFKHHFSRKITDVNEVLTVDSHEAVISAIANDVGLGVVASHLISDYLHDGTIVHVNTKRKEIANTISLVKLQDKVPTYTEKVFETFLIRTIGEEISGKNTGIKVLAGDARIVS